MNALNKFSKILVVLILILTLTTSFAAALGEDATIEVTRLDTTRIGIKIVFDAPISGNFSGVINGNHFNCETIPTNTIYCIGNLAYWVKTATFHLYETPEGTVVFTKAIIAPPKIGETEVISPSNPDDDVEEYEQSIPD